MPTADRTHFVPRALECFHSQDYENRELVVIDDGVSAVQALLTGDSRICYIQIPGKAALGAKRNRACQEARGEIIVHWDDDDWMASWRLSYQVDALLAGRADVCGLRQLLFCDPANQKAWRYTYPAASRFWVAGGTLCYRKSFWRQNPFPPINVGEDARFVWSSRSKRMIALDDEKFYVAMIHSRNTSPKRVRDPRYQPCSMSHIEECTGGAWRKYGEAAP